MLEYLSNIKSGRSIVHCMTQRPFRALAQQPELFSCTEPIFFSLSSPRDLRSLPLACPTNPLQYRVADMACALTAFVGGACVSNVAPHV